MLEIITKIRNTIAQYDMLCPGDRVVVGVSGGADSMLLLHYLLSVRDELDLDLVVANVEHGIRGAESVADTDFVVDYCHQHSVQVHTLSIDALSEAKAQGIGVEEYSRNRRYDFFRSLSPDKIATAHNLSDNVETVLFRMSRGTSIKGASGIQPVRDNIIRPLICCTSQEIRQYCDANHIEYRIDSTNSDDAYSRNFVRHKLVPRFEELNPSFQHTMARFVQSAKEDDDYITSAATQCYSRVVSEKGISVADINSFHISVVKRVVIMFAAEYGISLDELHLNQLIDLLHSPGKCQLKGSTFAVSNKSYFRITQLETSDNNWRISEKYDVPISEFLNKCELLKKEFDFYLDYDRIVGNIYIRSRQAGDSIVPAGRGVTKSVKKLFNECAIDIEKRDNLPLVCDDDGIICIKDCCISDRVRISQHTQRVLLFNIRTED